MRRFIWLVLLPAGLAAPQPAVSPVLRWALARIQDTTFSVWLFVQPWASLDEIGDRVAAAGGGARVRVRGRWVHAVRADVPATALRQLLGARDLKRVQPLGRFKLRPRPGRPVLDVAPRATFAPAAGPRDTCGVSPGDDPVLGPSAMPYRQLHLRPLTDQGIDATGVRIALLDTGFDTANTAFNGITITAQHDFVFNDNVVKDEPGKDVAGAQSHGTETWSLFAGDVAGRLVGIARGASYLLAKTEDVRSETRIEEDNYVAALEWADSIGVDIVSSSLGYLTFDNGFSYTASQLNGDVAVTSVAAESAAARGILVVTAAGNSAPGFRSLVTPGDADSIITAGAEDSLGTIAAFSSRGPTADGRLKPDLTAPGVAVCTIAGAGLGRLSGTSFATPLTAASAALLKQLHPALGPVALRDALRRFAANRAAPDSVRGWGRPTVAAAATFPDGVVPLTPFPPRLASVTPTFQWSAPGVPGFASPVTYRLRVARDSGFAAPRLDTTLVDQSSALVRRPYKPGGAPLYWRGGTTAGTGGRATPPSGVPPPPLFCTKFPPPLPGGGAAFHPPWVPPGRGGAPRGGFFGFRGPPGSPPRPRGGFPGGGGPRPPWAGAPRAGRSATPA